jgi:hypothetical protein
MRWFLRFIILLIGAAGFSSCGAASAGFLYSGEDAVLKAEPSRLVYSIKSVFDKKSDLSVYLYRADGGLSRVPIKDVTVRIRGEAVDSYVFKETDSGAWEVAVEYANMPPASYTITVLSADENAYYDNGGGSGGGGGIEIDITGP